MPSRKVDESSGAISGELGDESSLIAGAGSAVLGADSRSNGDRSIAQSDVILAEIVEEVTRRVQSGEHVDVEEYVKAHPEWAALLRSIISPLRELAQLRWPVPLTAPIVLPTTFGDFVVRREIGRGGMGIVYEAEQLSLCRRVALKILSAAGSLDAQSSRRFQVEAQAAACLNHERIVPVHAVGSHNDVPYYAMQLIDGASLAEIISALRRLRDKRPGPVPTDSASENPSEVLALGLLMDRFGPDGRPGRGETRVERRRDIECQRYIRAVVRLGAQVAEALDHAHEQGILHRDIKPANLMLDHAGKIWVTDFGLARIVGDDTLTGTGELAGTLRYMSPEQVRGKRRLVDRRTDLYSLGATLYELLTLEPAIHGDERWEILAQIDFREPRPLRHLNPGVPRDLCTIVAKAMAKDVRARYVTAEELGDDLNRFLDGRAIRARRARIWEHPIRLSRRNPAMAGLVIALAALAIVVFVGSTALTEQRRRANEEASRADQKARAESTLRLQAQVEATTRKIERALEAARDGDADRGLLFLADSLRHSPHERPELERRIRSNLASWMDQGTRLRTILEHQAGVSQAVFSADGRRVLTGSLDGTAQLWDALTGARIGRPVEPGEEVRTIAISPDDKYFLTGDANNKAHMWVTATGQRAGPALPHSTSLRTVRFIGETPLVVTVDDEGTHRIWNPSNGRLIGQVSEGSPDHATAMTRDGRLAVKAGLPGQARVWDLARGQPTGVVFAGVGEVTACTISPDNRLVAMSTNDGTTRLWKLATGQPTRLVLHGADACTQVLALSPDGRLVLTTGASGTRLQLWDSVSGSPVGRMMRHEGRVVVSSFSPDGRLLASGSDDHTARIWDTATGEPFGSPLRHILSVTSVSFSPDAKLVLTASEDGTAKIWDLGAIEIVSSGRVGGPRDDLRPRGGATVRKPGGVPFAVAAFSPDRRRVLLGSATHGVARLVDARTGQPVGRPILHRWPWVRAVAYSPDGRYLATASHDVSRGDGGTSSTCQIWDAATGRPTTPLLPHINYVAALAFRPDSKVLATGDYSGSIHLWDVETGTRKSAPLRAGSIVMKLAFSPDGRMLAAATAERRFQLMLWDLATGEIRGETIRFKKHVDTLAFSPDGRRIAAGSLDATARLVDVATGRAIGEPLYQSEAVAALVFSPDSRRLVTVSSGQSGAARLWDAASGEPRSAVLDHPAGATGAIAFAPQGTVFATGCADGSVHFWDVASATPIGPPRMMRGSVVGLTFSTDGLTCIGVDRDGDVRSWPIAEPTDEPVDRLITRLEVQSGLELDATREVAILDPESWRRRRAELDEPAAVMSPAIEEEWHDLCARDAEAIGDSHQALWHLDRMALGRTALGLWQVRHAVDVARAGNLAMAGREITSAIATGPREQVLDYLLQRAEDFVAREDPDVALQLLDLVTAARPDDWLGHALRADALARLGRAPEREATLAAAIDRGADCSFLIRLAAERGKHGLWRSAAELYDRAIARGTVPYEVWTQAALAHLASNDNAGYRRVCEIMRSRHHAQEPDRLVNYALASVCTLGPGGVGDDGKAQSWAECFLAAISPRRYELRHHALGTLGGILFRAGRHSEAIARIREGIAADGGEIHAADAALLAMAYQESGDHARALESLARLNEENPTASPLDFWDKETRHLLRLQAEEMVLDRAFPVDPFAHQSVETRPISRE